MKIPAAIKTRIDEKVRECLTKASGRYTTKTFKFPLIKYTVSGTVAGKAYTSRNVIDFNSVLLMENVDDFIERTVVHEIAHIIDAVVNPEGHQRRWNGRTYSKRSIHGPSWKNIMLFLGGDPSRCHSYDTSSVSRNSSTHEWKCGCGSVMKLGPKRHQKMLAGFGYFLSGHRHCTYTYAPSGTPVATVFNSKVGDRYRNPAKKATKLNFCTRVFNPTETRAQNIEKFVTLAGCTQAGAATYYAKIKKEHE